MEAYRDTILKSLKVLGLRAYIQYSVQIIGAVLAAGCRIAQRSILVPCMRLSVCSYCLTYP